MDGTDKEQFPIVARIDGERLEGKVEVRARLGKYDNLWYIKVGIAGTHASRIQGEQKLYSGFLAGDGTWGSDMNTPLILEVFWKGQVIGSLIDEKALPTMLKLDFSGIKWWKE